MADDVFRSSALDVLADAGPSVVSELLGRVRSFLTTATTAIETAAADDVETITPYPGAEDRSTPEAFDATLTALCGVLQRSDVSHNHTTLEAVADLAVAAFKALNEPPVIAPSSYTCILRSLWELMRVEREHVKEVARHLWYDDNVVELLSRLLQSLRDRNDAAETRGAVYDVVWLLCDLQNTPSSPSPTFPHDDNAFLAFAAEHILHDCHEPACRSLLMELCAHPSFRSYMLEFHEAAYRAAVHLAVAEKEEYSAAAVAALLSQCDASKK
ncbi:hypothetical protein DQ04_10831040 [Trypanosoma grayi]|uniref:hypothetical protein n=1 Tax=Trypanosoma grayi TaxID=71804 RepID=UPI0004F4403A|nr:hypothetical protein DQ04_10831040 [Trypanosoma grayi]KEG07121.1 hypothetical protein DQ04_10831040 [Trypanosoma grayi]